jgi:hypothetical protein
MTEHIYGATDGGDTMTPVGTRESENTVMGNGDRGRTTDDGGDTMRGGDGQSAMRGDSGTVTDGAELFDSSDAQSFRERWDRVQSKFVDDPRAAVEEADSLVADVTDSLTSRFAQQKSTLEQQWSQGDDAQTEDLRMTLQRYRTLFERLLAA